MRTSILAGLFAAFVAAASGASAQTMTCRVDKDISGSARAAPEKAALGFVTALLTGKAAEVDAALTPEAKAAAGDLDRLIKSVATQAPYAEVRAAHTYLIEGTGGPDPLPAMICGKSVTDPEAVLLARRAIPQQAHVEVTARSRDNDWSVFVYLAPQGGAWKVLSFDLHVASLAGRSARELQRLAQEQQAKGHGLTATLLLKAAISAADRGANARPVLKMDLERALKAMETPPAIAGDPPWPWLMDGRTYHVGSIGVVGQGRDLVLLIYRFTERWQGAAAADAESRDMISSLVNLHPELKEAFPAIVVRALKPDQSGGWATAYEFAKGFGQAPPADSP